MENTVKDFGINYTNLVLKLNALETNKEKLSLVYMWVKQDRISKLVFMSLIEEITGDLSGIWS